MPDFVFKIIGGFILLASWVSREMWGRKQEQLLSAYRRELDGKARAEDAYLVVLTQRRILDSIVFMQSTIGYTNQNYFARVGLIQHDLDEARKSYALERLSHLWAIVNRAQAHTDEKAKWNQITEDEIMKLGDELVPQIDLMQERLNRNTRWADRIVVVMYIIGALLVLASG